MSASNLLLSSASGNDQHYRAVPLSGDTELRVNVIAGLAGAPASLDIRLYRRGIPGTALTPTSAGLRCPLPLAAVLAEAIRDAADRAAS